MTATQRRRTGFSLVELLVVLAIIAVLLAILLPVISAARKQAQKTACLSNLRQLHQAFSMYIHDSKGKSTPFTFSDSESWLVVLRDHLKLSEAVYLCPRTGSEISSDFGTARTSWSLTLQPKSGGASISGGYGFNAWLLRWEPAGKGGALFSGGPREWYLLPSAKQSELIPVFADATWLDGWPRADDPTPPDLINGDRSRQGPSRAPKENMMARFTIARHGRSINIVFLDGHADSVLLEKIKRLKWHNGFVFQDWNPALPAK